jgi:GT2 family glycosyltransferase
MIIQVFANIQEDGYLSPTRHPTVAPFFAGANVAMRRDALRQVGGYDPACVTGEDCDICARMSHAGWDLYLSRSACVKHANPRTFRRLVSQWYGYGRYHPYVFAKHNDRALELYARLGDPAAGERYVCLFYRRWPVAVVCFLTTFLLLHLAALGALAAWLAGWTAAAWVATGLTALLALAYAWPDVRGSGALLGPAFALIRYSANLALFAGAFLGGLRRRMLYLSATVD